jgi:hypothetical protein
MKDTKDSLKESWKLKGGRILFITFLFLVFSPLNAQVDFMKESASIATLKGDLILAYVKKCPGEISGECFKSLFILSKNERNTKDFKRGEYHLQNSEFVIVFDPLYVQILLSNIEFSEENTLIELLKFFTEEKNLWNYNLEDFKTNKKGKIELKVMSNLENKALLIKANSSFYNSIFSYRIPVRADNDEITIAILFNNKSLPEIKRILNL